MISTPYSVVLEGGVLNTAVVPSRPTATLHQLYSEHKKPVEIPHNVDEYQAMPKGKRSKLKMSLPYFVGAVMDPPKRRDNNVTQRTLITLDIEQLEGSESVPPSPVELVKTLRELGGEGWIYTSLSHTPEQPRYRVVLPLGEFIEGKDATDTLKTTTHHAARKLGIEEWLDEKSWTLSQPMYLPAKLEDSQFKQWYVKGKAWKPVRTKPQRKEGAPAEIPDERPDPIINALRHAGLYLEEDAAHPGRHYFTCPWHEEHTTTNDTQTMYMAAHFNGFPHWSCKCMGTGPDVDGKPHMTNGSLTRWLKKEGHLTAEEQAKEGVMDDYDTFQRSSRLSTLLKTPPPPQDWALEHFAPIGSVTMLAAPGGQGKSLLMLHIAMYGAMGLPFAEFKVHEPLRTLYVSYEDGKRLMYDRIVDIGQELREHDNGVLDTLYDVDGSLDNNLSLHKVEDDAQTWVFLVKPDRFTPAERTARVEWLIGYIKQAGIRMVVLDPMVYTHQLQENDIADMAFFMQTLNHIAAKADCAVIVVHHMSKMGKAEQLSDIDQHSLRGASSITDNARSAGVLIGLPYKDAAAFGIEEADVKDYAVFKHVKSNYAAPLPMMVFQRRGRTLVYRAEIKRLDHNHMKLAREHKAEEDKQARIMAKAVEALKALDDHEEPISQNQVALHDGRHWNPAVTKAVLQWCEDNEYSESSYEGERKASKHSITPLGKRYLRAQLKGSQA